MTNAQFDALFGGPPRKPEAALTQRHMDLAASIQAVTEEVVLRLARGARARDRRRRTSAWPAAWRSTASPTARSCARAPSTNIWIQPAAGDAGGALGAALARLSSACWASRAAPPAARRACTAPISGPHIAQDEIERAADARPARVFTTLDDDDADRRDGRRRWPTGKAVGWFQGRMEFGPRALGARSILGDPRSPTMQKIAQPQGQVPRDLPPFAPAVLREDVADWFELDGDSPYMLLVADVAAERRRAR